MAGTPGGKCYYRSRDGLRCAIGVLIPDELYDPAMELKDVTHIIDEFSLGFLAEANIWDEEQEMTLLDELQANHDRQEFWRDPRENLIRIGEHFDLKTAFLIPKEST